MRRRVWSVEEIEAIMRAIIQASGMRLAALPNSSEAMGHYEAGFRAAVVALAIALGLAPGSPSGSDALARANRLPMSRDQGTLAG